jgi:hypothetical protein
MLRETPEQLVRHLSHPNGWWRDTAQRLIILRGDRSVVPALDQLARTGDNPLARLHALWTLDGLGALKRSVLAETFRDADPHVRAAAVRISEPLVADDDAG